MTPFSFQPIGIVHSPFKEKFGIPRQPGLAPSSTAVIELVPPFNLTETVEGLSQFSHVWVTFVFHATAERGWTPTVRPPRLGGNEHVGVFATRSTHRPNPIGLSVAELGKIETENGKVLIQLRNIDLMDGTPVLDIKPYLPYADAIPGAKGGYASDAPSQKLSVRFSAKAETDLQTNPQLKQLITEIISLDPRPAYKSAKADEKIYGIAIGDVDVKFTIESGIATVIEIINFK
ncbi:tRNA (N6-threonylcarbamoyladenosine(37)-N6)-methyltransferase TrmO [Solitalea longa]|uniref:tRNA (N6-threonylcarbamoyladenosine(37)-N6)-methyltransferase TrmO n=1 Tax=Solitalea longa TaxID=2079460 RepID=A0A2S5A900_9SPHI|nr:tRNA (N6-threonylcarbamoyladenosine(37)-N6)-methyltransferase TrmO [Solitalea longa]POY39058.1 tRNA (N6-threonylcarbamoyladenosine(37)-N6)-methyltransferase TrmO [Solitalea longa]